jgi:ABC-type transport system involved in cytochrome c biogenesis permease subunit
MPMLVAVLDTNFWLATHVTIINVGYAAGMLAAGIAHVYVLGRLLGIRKNDKAFYRGITRMVYGVTCFGLIFAFIGTVLGGIWANYSWGRFWGWDPKENGAALICLAMLATLHARMGGYIREMGLSLCAIATGCVVAFSWWGVNLLGVGLHSYGFTNGIWTATYIFWGTQALMIALGFGVLLRDRLRGGAAAAPPEADDRPAKKKRAPEPVVAK